MIRLRGSIVIATGVCMLPGAVAQTYSVDGEVSSFITTQTNTTSTNPGSASIADGSTVMGFATPTLIGASATAVQNQDNASMIISRDVNDWTVSGPAGTTTSSAMNLSLTGSLVSDSYYGEAYVALQVDVFDITGQQTVFDDSVGFEIAGEGFNTGTYSYIWDTNGISTGGFSTFVSQAELNPAAYTAQLPSGLTFSTNAITWVAGDVYDVTTRLTTVAEGGNPNSSSGVQDAAYFYDPFTFNPPQVLDLPNGWTLNSPQSGIVNNQVTPEPEAFAVLGLGLVGLMLRRRKG